MRLFSREFYEPYYDDYVEDDLESVFEAAGFSVESVESHFVSKLVVGRKRR
jgi:hypothetical protein